MYAGLKLAKTFVFCYPDQHNKGLADSKIELARLLLPMYARSKTFVANVRVNTTFFVATSQSQSLAFMKPSATVTFVINKNGGVVERRARGRVN